MQYRLISLVAAFLLLGQLLSPPGFMPARAADGALTFLVCTTAGAVAAAGEDGAPYATPADSCPWALAAVPALPAPETALPASRAEPVRLHALRPATAGPRGPPAGTPPPARAPPAIA